MAKQKQDNQHKHTFSNYVRIRDVVQKTCQSAMNYIWTAWLFLTELFKIELFFQH